MLVCPKCNIDYEEGKKFCRKCGSFLLSEEGSTFELPIVGSTELKKREENLFCPTCQEYYRKGKYCRKCGASLVQGTPFQEHETQRIEKKPLRRLGKEWMKSHRTFSLITTNVAILLAIIAGYFFSQKHAQPSHPIIPPSQNPTPVIETKEAKEIMSLFETIKQANLEKNIDLFMSCYSQDFKDRKRKRLDTLESWKTFNYLNLTYDLKSKTVSGNTANVRVEWLMKISQKETEKREDSRSISEVVLKREGNHWKIKEIQPIS